MAYLNFNLQLFTAILMIIVFSGNLMTGYSRMRSFSFFLLLMLSDIVMLLTGAADNYVLYKTSIYEHYRWLEALLSGVSDLSYFAILGFFILYLDSYEKDDSKRSVFALLGSITAAISGIFWLVTDFIGGIYTQNAESIAYEPLYMLGQSGGYFTCIFTVIILIKRWKCFSHRERAGFVMFIGIPFVGSF